MLSHLPQFVNPTVAGANLPLRRWHGVHTLAHHHGHGGGLVTLFLVLIVIALVVVVAVTLYRKSQSRTTHNAVATYNPASAPWQSGVAAGAPWQSHGACPAVTPYATPAFPAPTWTAAPTAPAWSGAQAGGWAAPAVR